MPASGFEIATWVLALVILAAVVTTVALQAAADAREASAPTTDAIPPLVLAALRHAAQRRGAATRAAAVNLKTATAHAAALRAAGVADATPHAAASMYAVPTVVVPSSSTEAPDALASMGAALVDHKPHKSTFKMRSAGPASHGRDVVVVVHHTAPSNGTDAEPSAADVAAAPLALTAREHDALQALHALTGAAHYPKVMSRKTSLAAARAPRPAADYDVRLPAACESG